MIFFDAMKISTTVLLCTTTILDIAPIDLTIGKKLLLQYLSFIYRTILLKSVKILLSCPLLEHTGAAELHACGVYSSR